jgi:SAM-dependent methyltransferase
MASDIKTAVSEQYGEIARQGVGGTDARARNVAQAFGYSDAELASIPAEANMGLSCGNPTATANLRPGETVVDLGSGCGLDVFLAAQKVGPTGMAIGIDMTRDMIDLARENARKAGLDNVAFHLAEIEDMPLEDASVDCVISNCVLILVPDKLQAFREIYRILKPGGRLAVSDIALKAPLPADLADRVAACIGRETPALAIETYDRLLREAGFAEVRIVDSKADLNVDRPNYAPSSCAAADDGRPVSTSAALRSLGIDVNAYAASVKVFALK